MRSRGAFVFVAAVAACVVANASAHSPAGGEVSSVEHGGFKARATVVRVIDGDTLQVRMKSRKLERVRLIGIDAPEVSQCYFAQATEAMKTMVLAKRVTLAGDRTQSTRDIYGRLLAYVAAPSGIDVGLQLLRGGFAQVYATQPRFLRQQSYENVAQDAQLRRAGVWACVTPPTTTSTSSTSATTATPTFTTTTTITTTTTSATTTTSTADPRGGCAPSYPDVCIPPPPPDLNCGDISYRNFRVIYNVPSPDPHRFDGDHDEIGCEK